MTDLDLAGGGTLHVRDTGEGDAAHVVVWHHGTPNLGPPPAPLLPLSAELGVRWVSWDRPGYGASTPRPGRDVASAATCAEQVADRLGIERFAVMGHSGGAPHALACAALLPDRVPAAALLAGLSPHDASDPGWFDGMAASGRAALGAAAQGREARARWEEEHGDSYDPEFTETDLAALQGEWGWFGSVVGPALTNGPGPAIDDDVAYVAPWGFDPAAAGCPVLLVHGDADRVVPPAHSARLAAVLPHVEWWELAGAGHLAVMHAAADALRWLVARS